MCKGGEGGNKGIGYQMRERGRVKWKEEDVKETDRGKGRKKKRKNGRYEAKKLNRRRRSKGRRGKREEISKKIEQEEKEGIK